MFPHKSQRHNRDGSMIHPRRLTCNRRANGTMQAEVLVNSDREVGGLRRLIASINRHPGEDDDIAGGTGTQRRRDPLRLVGPSRLARYNELSAGKSDGGHSPAIDFRPSISMTVARRVLREPRVFHRQAEAARRSGRS
jgi:hypothetical protein